MRRSSRFSDSEEEVVEIGMKRKRQRGKRYT